MAEVLEKFQTACNELDEEIQNANEKLKNLRLDITNMLSKEVKTSFNETISSWKHILVTEKTVSTSTIEVCDKLLDFQKFLSKEIEKQKKNTKNSELQISSLSKKSLAQSLILKDNLEKLIKCTDDSGFAHYEFRKSLSDLESIYNSHRQYSDSSATKKVSNLSLKATKGVLELVSGGANTISMISGPSLALNVTSSASKLGASSIDALESSLSTLMWTMSMKKKQEISLVDLKKQMPNEALLSGLWNSMKDEFENVIITVSDIIKSETQSTKPNVSDSEDGEFTIIKKLKDEKQVENLKKLLVSSEKLGWFKFLRNFFQKFSQKLTKFTKISPKPLKF